MADKAARLVTSTDLRDARRLAPQFLPSARFRVFSLRVIVDVVEWMGSAGPWGPIQTGDRQLTSGVSLPHQACAGMTYAMKKNMAARKKNPSRHDSLLHQPAGPYEQLGAVWFFRASASPLGIGKADAKTSFAVSLRMNVLLMRPYARTSTSRCKGTLPSASNTYFYIIVP